MLSGLMENRYTFTTWPALCKTKEDQAGGGEPGDSWVGVLNPCSPRCRTPASQSWGPEEGP